MLTKHSMEREIYNHKSFLKKIKSNRKLVIVNTTRQFLIILPLKRDLWMCCVQIKTALRGRHCILKQGHDVFITLSRSIHVILTKPHEVCCQLCRKVIAHSLLPKIQFTHYRGYQPSIMTLIKKTSVRSELEVVIWPALWSGSSSQVFMWRRTDRCSFF